MLGNALICSKDPQLLETRTWLFEKAGFSVTQANSVETLKKLEAGKKFDLAVLGQSLSASDLDEAVKLICQRWPATRILVLNVTGNPVIDAPDCEHLQALNGPMSLLAKAKEMMEGLKAE
jgi:DNA-binding response OmpR family regulator